MLRFLSVLAACAVVATAVTSPAPVAAEDGVVTISGKLEPGAEVSLDGAAMAAFDTVAVETSTDWDWHEGVQKFVGIPAPALLEKAGAAGTEVTLTAIDDYSVTFPISELEKYNAIFATSLNDTTLTSEDFGPLWLVFDYDDIPKEERETFTARSVWALVSIKVE